MSDDYSLTMEPDWDYTEAAWQHNVVHNRQGQRFSLIEDGDDPLDFSRRSGAFDWHTDGLYHEKPPKYVTQYCLHPGEKGIKTALADSKVILENMYPDEIELLKQLDIQYVSHGVSKRHAVVNSEGGLFLGVGFKDENDYTAIIPGTKPYVSIRAIAGVISVLYREIDRHKIIIYWEKGKLLKFNQYRYLHCRYGAAKHDTRKFVRIWSNE